MGKILEPKVQASGLMDVALLGVSKSVTERLLTPVIGNASYQSGAIKLIAGGLIQGKGKVGKIAGGGLVIDAMEDIVAAVMSGGGVGGVSGSDEWA